MVATAQQTAACASLPSLWFLGQTIIIVFFFQQKHQAAVITG